MGPYADLYVTKNIVIRGHAGYLIGSSLDEYTIGDKVDWSLSILKFGDDRTRLSSIDVEGMFYTASLVFRINTD